MNPRHIIPLILLISSTSIGSAQNGLLLSEVLYQPTSGEAEYLELYNPTAAPIDLAEYQIIRWRGDTLSTRYPLPTHRVEAHSYVVLTKDAASVLAHYPAANLNSMVECNLPTYPNEGGTIVLATDQGVAERLDYHPEMHSRLLRNKAGVSLERRSYDRPCNEPSNWFSAASTAGYGTPTLPNSQSTEWLAEEASFTLSNELLSPDGDGYQDELTINYTLDDGNLYANIDIYDAAGRPVKKLLKNGLLGTHGTLTWDGRTEAGHLSQGRYILSITLYNPEGTRQTLRRTIAIVAP